MRNGVRILCLAMAMLIFSGCGGKAEAIPPQPRGTLAAISYSRRVDMVRDENYSVRVTPREIESIEFFVEEDGDYRHETDVPLDEGQWQELESVALELLPGLTESKPKKETLWERLFKKEDPFLMDGGDSTTLCFEWETEEGIMSVSYHWRYDDPKAQELFELLYALQDNGKGE